MKLSSLEAILSALHERAMIGEILPDLPVRFVCLETLMRMKEAVGRPKDLEDIRQLALLAIDRRHE
jgi:acyl carrier protein phosphodiesterase